MRKAQVAGSVSVRHEVTPPPSKTSSGQTSHPEPAGRQQPSRTPCPQPGLSCSHHPSPVACHHLMHVQGDKWRLLLGLTRSSTIKKYIWNYKVTNAYLL